MWDADHDPEKAIVRLNEIEQTMRVVIEILRIMGEKLDAILGAATTEPGPSETTRLLAKMVEAQERTTDLLEDLPANIGVIFRSELELFDAGSEDDPAPTRPAEFDG